MAHHQPDTPDLHTTSDRPEPMRPAGWLLLPAAAAFAAGILTADHFALPTAASWWLIGLLAVGLVACHRRRQTGLAILLLPLFFFSIGLRYGLPPQPPTDPCHLYNLIDNGQTVTVSGVLSEAPQRAEEKSRLRLELDGLLRDGVMRRAAGTVQLSVAGMTPPELGPGDHLLARARFSTISNYGNPGSFDYQRFMAAQGIWLTGWINQPALLLPIRTPNEESRLARLAAWPESLRWRLAGYLDQHLEPAIGGLYKAILTGMRNSIPPATDASFKATGSYHLLAISGLHVGLLGLLSSLAIASLLKRSTWLLLRINLWKVSGLLSLIPITLYALLAGFQPPVFRATVMAALFILAFVGNRQPNIANGIAGAALLVLAWQPASIHTAAFQLSFAAVIAIAAIYPWLKPLFNPDAANERPDTWQLRALQRLKSWGLASLLVSLAAMLGTLPLLLLHFNRFSLLSPIATLLIEPPLCLWGLLWGIPASFLALLGPDLALPLFTVGGWGLLAANRIAELLASLPINSIWLPTPTWPEIACYYLLLTALLGWRRAKLYRWLGLTGLLTLALFIGQRLTTTMGRTATTVTYLDVGQGSSTLLELPGGRTILIDGGGSFSERFNVGEGIIAPFLWQRSIMRLDAMIITHPHADHYNGLGFIVERFRPATVWIPSPADRSPDYQALLTLARNRGCQVTAARLGEVLWAEGEVELVNLADWQAAEKQPGSADWLAFSNDPNNRGLVVQLRHGKRRFLFPGDIGVAVEKRLVEGHGAELSADALLVPHHGSATSSSALFIQQVAPDYAVISGNSKSGDQAVLARYRQQHIRLLETARQGAISMSTDGDTLTVSSFADQNPP